MIDPVIEEFARVTAIPRPSGGEAGIRDYVAGVARGLGLRWREDAAGNLAVYLPPSPGMEAAPGFIVQAHLDMVCVSERPRDFALEPPRIVERDGWLSAEGTSLGADNGVGIAMAVCLARDPGRRSGPLSLLFTVEEETGMRGASALSPELLDPRASYAVNVDFESESHVCIGCAGGLVVKATARLPVERADAADWSIWNIEASGVQGGHSGLDIDKRPGNLHQRLVGLASSLGARIIAYRGGDAVNSVPTRAELTIATPRRGEAEAALAAAAASFASDYAWPGGSPCLRFHRAAAGEGMAFPAMESSSALARTILGLPQGVVSRDPTLGGVRTSSSLGLLSLSESGELTLGATARSDDPAEAEATKGRILEALARLPEVQVDIDEFPAWKPEPASPLVGHVQAARRGLFAGPAELVSVHAGIECGVLSSKRPGLKALSIGPDVAGAHTVGERASVASIGRVYSWLKAILAGAGELPAAMGGVR